MFSNELVKQAEDVLNGFRGAGLRLATAESCTGGLIAGCLTEIAGSSDVVERGFVTYSNEAKTDLIGVPPEILKAHGAVSPETAQAMASGAVANSRADVAVSVTGVAGPGGGTAEKPVGLVYFGLARRGGSVRVERHIFPGDRSAVRLATVAKALSMLEEEVFGQKAAATTSPDDDLMARLAAASAGLLWPSESDHPIAPFRLGNADSSERLPDRILRAEGREASTHVEEVSADELFAPMLEEESAQSAPSFRGLFEVLKRELSELQAVRVGKVDIDVYVVGRRSSGEWMGVKTHVVET